MKRYSELKTLRKFLQNKSIVCIEKLQKDRKIGTRGPKVKPWKIEVHLVNRSQIKKLNQEYRNKDRSTDVLSFPNSEVFFKQGFLGSVFICYSVAREQANQFNHSLRTEIEILLVHGVLHLLGFDHEKSDSDAKSMLQAERRVLKQLNSRGAASLISRNC